MFTDFLQDFAFWAFDASAPILAPVFTPMFGFSKISAPHITAEVESFKDGTFLYQRHVIKGASVGAITFERGASMADSDFYDWISYAIYGTKPSKEEALTAALQAAPGVRRNLVLVHFSRIDPIASGNVSIGPFEFAGRLAARAWLLHNCIPTDYQAANDFDATSPAISMMKLIVQPEFIEEFSLGLKP